ncbi:MAG: class II aldolase/adducin family protein [Burkholderiales bacterium]
MTQLDQAIRELVIANRILANEGVVDAYGHVSIRHPAHRDRYLLSRSRSPELVTQDDIMTFSLDSKVAGEDKRPPYLERFIHGAIYAARPEINAVVHSHAKEVLPFTITSTRLRPVVHSGSCIGAHIPVWDIADKFGETDMLVRDNEQGGDLARCMGGAWVALMRGHGFAAAGRSLFEVVRIGVYMPYNARVYLDAMRMGEVKFLSDGEITKRANWDPASPEMRRAWEYWARRAGCADLLETT